MGEDLTRLTSGRKERRVDAMVTLETDAAIAIMAERMGGANMRSEAVRGLLARGIALEPALMSAAIEHAAQIRSGQRD